MNWDSSKFFSLKWHYPLLVLFCCLELHVWTYVHSILRIKTVKKLLSSSHSIWQVLLSFPGFFHLIFVVCVWNRELLSPISFVFSSNESSRPIHRTVVKQVKNVWWNRCKRGIVTGSSSVAEQPVSQQPVCISVCHSYETQGHGRTRTKHQIPHGIGLALQYLF